MRQKLGFCLRITSTYVENTFEYIVRNINPKDHLHILGEYSSWLISKDSRIGSPPHTWRIPDSTFNTRIYLRITSTYLENTLLTFVNHVFSKGSPPHTWRILWVFMFSKNLLRITSTYVENTLCCMCRKSL